jgi:hypothetical protein
VTRIPHGYELIHSPVELQLGTFVPLVYDAKLQRNTIMWYRVQNGFGSRGDREDWVADLPVSVSVSDYHWNGSDFGPSYGTFDNACLQVLRIELLDYLPQMIQRAKDKLSRLESASEIISKALDTSENQ